MEEGHALLDCFSGIGPHPYAGGSTPGSGVLPSAHGCKTNQKVDEQALVLTITQCTMLERAGPATIREMQMMTNRGDLRHD
jgi:hypothetical protein